MKRFLLVFLMGFLSNSVAFSAAEKSLNLELLLNKVKVVKAQEIDGDELYFTTSVYRKNESTVYSRIPEKPAYFNPLMIKKAANLSLWSGDLTQGQSVAVVISLNELDQMLLDPDELIGSMRVIIQNDKGSLKTRWSIPNRMEGPETIAGQKGDIQKFDLFGPNGHYEVYLSLVSKK